MTIPFQSEYEHQIVNDLISLINHGLIQVFLLRASGTLKSKSQTTEIVVVAGEHVYMEHMSSVLLGLKHEAIAELHFLRPVKHMLRVYWTASKTIRLIGSLT